MIEPSALTENIQEVLHPQYSNSTSQTRHSIPQPLSPSAKRMLFQFPSISTSNKRLTEENHLHDTTRNGIVKLSDTNAPTIEDKEKGLQSSNISISALPREQGNNNSSIRGVLFGTSSEPQKKKNRNNKIALIQMYGLLHPTTPMSSPRAE
ncbi:hypothetical protein Fot_24935 [Forsythia ovata]|uniref:Uncharacterized protein n=1 Tax=Forsythia ovata TaxID=205694 RepID=A0ABD1U7R5_9LAMI